VNGSQSKILYEENVAYILKMTRHPSLLTRPRLHSYRKAASPRKLVRNHRNIEEDNNQC
jgi:hypothetical protein